MEEQRPGQTFTPQSSQSPETQTPKTSSEISEIDAAMEGQPPTPTATPATEAPPAAVSSSVMSTQPPEAAPAGEMTGQSEPAPQDPESREEPLLQWSAAESAKDPASLFKAVLLLGGVGAVLLAGLIVATGFGLGSILGALAVLLGTVALYLTGRQHMKAEDYAIYANGIAVGQTYYPLDELESFGIAFGDEYCVELVPTKRFMPRISVYLEPASAEEVLSMMADMLPRDDKEPDFVDRLYKKLGI